MKKIFLCLAVLAMCFISVQNVFCERLDVKFLAQAHPGDPYYIGQWGTATKNCGPTSVIMVADYFRGIYPEPQEIRYLNDWMVQKGIISSVNGYNGQNTVITDLVRIAKEYYGFSCAIARQTNDIDLLRKELAAGNPVIVGVNIKMDTANGKHFMVITEITDSTVRINDPGQPESNNLHNCSYSISQFQSSWAKNSYASVVISKVGMYNNTTLRGKASDAVAISYIANGGVKTFGKTWDNGAGDEFVHSWPDNANDPDAIDLQDFLNGDHWWVLEYNKVAKKAFPVHGRILDRQMNTVGYLAGPPVEAEKYWTAPNGHKIVFQHFQTYSGKLSVIAYDTLLGTFLSDAECKNIPLVLDNSVVTFEDALKQGGVELIKELSGYGGGSGESGASSGNGASSNSGSLTPPQRCSIGEKGHVYPGCSLQTEILLAEHGDVIIVHPGSYGNIQLGGREKPLTIKSIDPDNAQIRETTFIDGHVDFLNSGSDTMLNGLTMRGGISITDSSPTIKNCIVVGGTKVDGKGGGIFCKYSQPSITNCVIKGNSAPIGGGIYCYCSSPILKDCIISENTATHTQFSYGGGALYCENSSPILENCLLYKNTATSGYGNEIYCAENSRPVLTNCNIVGWDYSISQSKSIECVYPATISLTNCQFLEKLPNNAISNLDIANQAIARGYTQMGHVYQGQSIQGMIELSEERDTIIVHPGIYAENIDFMGKAIKLQSENPYSEAIVKSTVLTKNWTGPIVKFSYGQNASNAQLSGFTIEKGEAKYGAGIYIESCAPTISNCIICNNSASEGGGGICFSSGWNSPTNIHHCVIANNSARWSGGGVYCRSGSDFEISNCVFTANSANQGSAIYATYDARPQVRNCIFWDNSRPIISRDYSYRDSMVFLYDSFLQNDHESVYAGNRESNFYIYEPPKANVIEKQSEGLYIVLDYPYDHASSVSVNKDMSWKGNADTYYIYMSTSRNGLSIVVDPTTEKSLPLNRMASRNYRYFYKIVGVRGTEIISSPIYEFWTGNY